MLRGLYLSTLRRYAELILCYTMDNVEWELAAQLLRYFIGGFPWIFLNNLNYRRLTNYLVIDFSNVFF